MRVLVTGSRSWTDRKVIHDALRQVWLDAGQPVPAVLVSGHCPTGADALCEDVWDQQDLMLELHPAEWDKHGKAAGFRRNKEMVQLGADVCLAFISRCTSPRCEGASPHPSHGATHCADLAERSGIPTVRYLEIP